MSEIEKLISADAYFPIQWCFGEESEYQDGRNGPPPEDATTIYFVLRIGDDEDGVHWEFKLTDIIDEFIESTTSHGVGTVGEDHRHSYELLRNGLRRLADEIDAALRRT